MKKRILIECPVCMRVNEASVSFFSKRRITCACGYVIDVRDARKVTKECPHCGNIFVYDKAKNPDPLCPVCHEHVLSPDEDYKFVELVCPTCSCHIIGKKDDTVITCPICETQINVQKRLREQEYISQNQPLLIQDNVPGDVIVYKYPVENFHYGTQIIVDDSHFAVFITDGKVVGRFESGRYQVTKDNVIIDRTNFTGGNVSFSSKLYFVNKAFQTNLKWGTDSKIRLFDPSSGLFVELGAYGTYSYKIDNFEHFLFNVLGTSQVNQENITSDTVASILRPIIVNIIKTNLAKVIKDNKISVLELDQNTDFISKNLWKSISDNIAFYGISIIDFSIGNIITPDDDPNFRKLKEQFAEHYLRVKQENIEEDVAIAKHGRVLAETGIENDSSIARAKAEAEIARIKAQAEADAYRYKAEAEATEMRMKGYTYQDETQRNVSTIAAQNMKTNSNEGGSGMLSSLAMDTIQANAIKEVGKRVAGSVVSSIANDSSSTIPMPQSKNEWTCEKCGKTGITTKFCPDCGNPRPVEKATWNCPDCKTQNITTNFCPNCGRKRS